MMYPMCLVNRKRCLLVVYQKCAQLNLLYMVLYMLSNKLPLAALSSHVGVTNGGAIINNSM